MRVRLAVPRLVVGPFAQTMVARQIDDQVSATLELGGAVRSVRKAEEEHIAPGHVLVPHELQVRALPQIWMRGRHRLAGERLATGDDLTDLRVAEQQSQQLAAGVAAGADDAGLHRGAAAART